MGLSYEKYTVSLPNFFESGNSALINLLNLLGPGMLRFGGDSVDQVTWVGPASSGKPDNTYGWVTNNDVSATAGFINALTNWQVLYGTNLGGFEYSSLNPYFSAKYGISSPALAAQELVFAKSAFGSSLYGYEIGNEPDSGVFYYGTESPITNPPKYTGFFAPPQAIPTPDGQWDVADYEWLWPQYNNAITAPAANGGIGPNATSGVVTTALASGHFSTWIDPFITYIGKKAVQLVTEHYYKICGCNGTTTTAKLVAYPDTGLTGSSGILQQLQSLGLPFRIAEGNGMSDGGQQGVTNALANALWVIDYMMDIARAGGTGVNITGGGSPTNPNGASWYTPILDTNSYTGEAITGIGPIFYGMALFGLVGTGQMYGQSSSMTFGGTGNPNVTAFAINTGSGINVIINNKETVENFSFTLNMPANIASATALVLTGAGNNYVSTDPLSQQNVTIQGTSVEYTTGLLSNGSKSNWGTPYTLTGPSGVALPGTQVQVYAPAASAVFIQMTLS